MLMPTFTGRLSARRLLWTWIAAKSSSKSLKFRIDDERGRQLLVVFLEGELVLTLIQHLHPHSCLAYPTTPGPVGLQQVFSSVAMKTALTKVLALTVLALIVEEAVEVLDPGVVKFAGHFNQQQVDPWYLLRLLAEAVGSYALVPAKYIDGQLTLLLHFGDLRDGRGGIDPLKLQTIFGWVPSWSLLVMWWRWICQSRSERPPKTVVIPVFHVDYCLLRSYSCWEWDVRAASQWLIFSDVQPESLHSVDHPTRPSLCPIFEQLQEVGMALFRSSLISLAWRRASCLWRSTGLCIPHCRLGCPSEAGP